MKILSIYLYLISLRSTFTSSHLGLCVPDRLFPLCALNNFRSPQCVLHVTPITKLLKNSVALVRQRTIPIEQPPLLGEVSANFSGQRVSRGQRKEIPTAVNFGLLNRSRYFLSNSSIILTRLSGPRSRPTTSQKIW
jgi:hypothetical protein